MAIAPSFSRVRRFLRDVRGGNAVEFAFLSPIILMMALLTIDLGMGGYRQMQVQSAAQAGAEYVVVNGFDQNAVAAAVASATPNSNISASPSPTQFCACSSGGGLTVATCGSTCDNNQKAGTYVSVYTALTYHTVVSYPGVPNSYPLVGQATMRLQ